VVAEALVILIGALLYFQVRGLMHAQTALAIANGEDVIALERWLGIYHERWLQAQVLRADWLVAVSNIVYIFGHWPVVIATLIWLIWKHRPRFARYRSALLISGAIGLAFFLLLPTAPPRLVDGQGFVDTVTERSRAYRVLQPPQLTNQYAALPSLHVGWNLLMGIAIVRNATTWWARAFGYVMPAVMFLSTVVTANHYILDGMLGSAIALFGLVIAIGLESRGPRVPIPV
jgi:hypothetical protein